MPPKDQLLRYFDAIGKRRVAVQRRTFSPEDVCRGPDGREAREQRAFIESSARRVAARCSRRAGKTVGDAAKALKVARDRGAPVWYFGPTLKHARQLFWLELKSLNARYGLGGVPHEVDLQLRLPNGGNVAIAGMKDQTEIERARGFKGALAIIDEAQSARPMLLQALIQDIVEPMLLDYDGQLVVTFTPGPVRAGFAWDIDSGALAAGWDHHRWTMRDNPFLAPGRSIEEILAEVRERHGWTQDHPTYRREYLGEWVEDPGALMFHYDAVRNGCVWQTGPQAEWTYVIGGDLGYDDADALSVLGWAPNSRKVQKVAEFVRAKQGVTELMNATRGLYETWRPMAMVFDFGGLGKKIGIELQQRYGLPVEAADKTRKAEHVALLDDALIAGQFLAPTDSRFAQDCAIMQWEPEAKAKGILREDPGFHSDICDADLYAFRRCMAFLETPEPAKPATVEERAAEGERAMLAARLEAVVRANDPDRWMMGEDG